MHVEKRLGRIETRRAAVCHDIEWLEDHEWPGLAAVGAVTATREVRGGTGTGIRYFILNERRDPERFLREMRAHRRAENSLHRVRMSP